MRFQSRRGLLKMAQAAVELIRFGQYGDRGGSAGGVCVKLSVPIEVWLGQVTGGGRTKRQCRDQGERADPGRDCP